MKRKPIKSIRAWLPFLAALMLTAAAAGAHRETIKFTKTQLTVREALTEIKAQAGYGMAFNGKQLDADRTVTLTSAELTLAEAMKQILDGSGSSYILNDNFIFITKSADAPPKEVAAPPRSSSLADDNIYRHSPSPDLNAAPQPVLIADRVTLPESAPVTVAADPRLEPDLRREPAGEDAVEWVSIPTVAVKTNLLYDATATFNLGAEFRLGGRTSLDVPINWNPFTFANNRKWRHVLVQPELRLWTRETFEGHFFGLHAHYAFYNVGNLPKPFSQYMRDHRFQGWLAGVGVSYGYRWNFNQHWGMEATVGVGYAYMDYEKYACRTCGEKLGSETKNYFGPTKVGLSLVYNIGKKKQSVPAPVPVYNPLVVIQEEPAAVVVTQPEPQPELQSEPQPEPEIVPQPTTGEKLAMTFAFIAPADDYSQYLNDKDTYIDDNREGALTVYFKQGSGTIDFTYRDNSLSFDRLIEVVNEIQRSEDSRVVQVVIAGFASPEGSSAINDRLARERAATARRYLVEHTSLRADQVDIHNGGIDWRGLRKLVAASDMTGKQQVLDIIDNTPVWDAKRNTGRHGELMRLNGGETYRYMLRNFFPELRNATYIRVYYENK